VLEQQTLIIKGRDGWRIERHDGELCLVFKERYVSSGTAIEAANALFPNETQNFELIDEVSANDAKFGNSQGK